MERDLAYYLNLPYTIELIPDLEEGGWVAQVKELPGCISAGETPNEAVEMIRSAMESWLVVAIEDGLQIPEPRSEESYSGRFVVRLPKSLHRHLVERANQESVSLNQLVTAALAGAMAWPNLQPGAKEN